MSSRSSIVTDYSHNSVAEDTDMEAELMGANQQRGGGTYDEGALEANIMQDSDELLIPDEMQRFLSEKYQTGTSQQGRSEPTTHFPSPRPRVDHSPNRNSVTMGMGAETEAMQPQGMNCHPPSCMHQSSQPQEMPASQWAGGVGPDADMEPRAGCPQPYATNNNQGLSTSRQSGYSNMGPQQQAPMMPQYGGNQYPQYGPMPPPMSPVDSYGTQMMQQQQQQMGPMSNMVTTQNFGNQWPMMGQGGIANGNQMQPQQQPGYANEQQYFNQSGSGMGFHPPMMMSPMGGKAERQSPQVQVPHISQSQIPPKAKAAGQYRKQQIQQQLQHQQQYANNMRGSNSGNMYGGSQDNMMPPPPVPRLNPNQNPHSYAQYAQQMAAAAAAAAAAQGSNQGNPMPCPQNGTGEGNPMSLQTMQMSPGCNQVTSTTDMKDTPTGEGQQPTQSQTCADLASISADNLMDNLSSISMENIGSGPILSPTALMNRSLTASQNSSRMTTPYTDGKTTSQSGQGNFLDTSNMVVNDMGSMLNQLAEENKYLGMRG